MVYAVKTPITRKRIRDHFAYALWKYLLLVVIGAFGWNLIYSVTAYRPPKEKKVDVYLVTASVETDAATRLAELASPAFPDMEALNFLSIAMGTEDDYYANIQLTTYIGAQEGDLYLMTYDRFRSFAESGLFIPLDEYIASGDISLDGMDAGMGILAIMDESAPPDQIAPHQYGIPAESLYGMLDIGVDNRGLWIGVTAYSGNTPNAVKMADWLIDTFKADKPQWLIDYEAAQPAPPPIDEPMPSY